MGKDNYISTAKAIGIILMVVGHAISQNFAYRYIYMFHMPLFFFCSGYFYKVPASLGGVGLYAQKRIKGLYYPYVKWGVLFLLFHNVFCSLRIYDTKYIYYYDSSDFLQRFRSLLLTMTGQDQLLDPFWFLKELLLSSMLVCVGTYLLQKVKFKYKDILFWLFLFLVAVISKHYKWGLPVIWNLSIMFLSATFVYMGYLYRRLEKDNYYSVVSLVICFFIILIIVWVRDDYLDMLWYNEYNVFLYVPTAFIGVFMILSVSKIIDRWPVKKFLYYIGNHTMIIFVLHLLVFKIGNLLKIVIYDLPIEKLADYKIILEHNEFFWFVYVLLGCIIPLLFDYYYRQIGRKYFGKKK